MESELIPRVNMLKRLINGFLHSVSVFNVLL